MLKMNSKTMGALCAVAVAVVGSGCLSTGPQKQPWERYHKFLDPKAEDFQFQKEAWQNAGKVVEATFVPGPDGKMVAIYGVRDRTMAESACDHLNKYAPLYDMGRWGVNTGIQGVGLGYQIEGVHQMEKINHSVNRNTEAIRRQSNNGNVLFR